MFSVSSPKTKMKRLVYFYTSLIVFTVVKLSQSSNDTLFDIFSNGFGLIFWTHLRNLDYNKNLNINPQCASSLKNLVHSLKNGNLWAYKSKYFLYIFVEMDLHVQLIDLFFCSLLVNSLKVRQKGKVR